MTDEPFAEDPFELNRLAWDERVTTHLDSPLYQHYLERLRSGGVSLEADHVEALGDVTGRSLLHLQCHLGMETVSWARLGATVTGLDFSAPALVVGGRLAAELGVDARFVHGNVYDAPALLGRRYDIVFVSVGSIGWLPDLDGWARVVADLLEPGGRLLLQETHPFAEVFDDHRREAELAVTYPYLAREPFHDEDEGTYADLDARFEHNRTVSWVYPIGDVITALAMAGLRIDALHESRDCMWPRFRLMTQVAPDRFELPDPYLDAIPNTYTLLATREPTR